MDVLVLERASPAEFSVEWHREAILSGKKVQLSGKLISLKGPSSIKKSCRPRNGKQRENEQDFKDLVKALFGDYNIPVLSGSAYGDFHLQKFGFYPLLCHFNPLPLFSF